MIMRDISIVPALPGYSAFGEREEEALAEVKNAISLWIETTHSEGRDVPEPSNHVILKKITASQKMSVS